MRLRISLFSCEDVEPHDEVHAQLEGHQVANHEQHDRLLIGLLCHVS